MKIGIIKEGKVPVDHRVPFTPKQCRAIIDAYGVELVVQPSNIRCFKDEDYLAEDVPLQDDLNDCDILFGVKEVPLENLLAGKTYFFFSHTIKKQEYNRGLLQKIINQKINLVDYECLTNEKGARVVAFGRFAGIVGAYNAFLTWGLREGAFELKRAHKCFDMKELWSEFAKVKLDPIKIVLTGGGRVARGAQEVLNGVGIKEVSSIDFISKSYEEPVYVQLDSDEYNKHKEGKPFEFKHFYTHPEEYNNDFSKFLKEADMFIAGAYWDPKAPVLFTPEDTQSPDFKTKVIADITCDIRGSVPTTLRSTTIASPCYDYDPNSDAEAPEFSSAKNITVMAVDNLPCELPRDASTSFGDQLLKNVMPTLLGKEETDVVEGAMITKSGSLTNKFKYLQDFIEGK